MWKEVDCDWLGMLLLDEMRVVFDYVGMVFSVEDDVVVFVKIDLNNNGVVEFEEFVVWFIN